jgi:hypothetical protein
MSRLEVRCPRGIQNTCGQSERREHYGERCAGIRLNLARTKVSFLTDPKWAGVGAIAGVVGACLTLVELSRVGSDTPLKTQLPHPAQAAATTANEGSVGGSGHYLLATSNGADESRQKHAVPLPQANESVEATALSPGVSGSDAPVRISSGVTSDENAAGGTTVVVGEFGDATAGGDLESALLEALEKRGWSGLHSGGTRTLLVSGSLRDVNETLGQIATASASARWQLRSPAGVILSQGGVGSRLGTGLEQPEARAAAIRRMAQELAVQVIARMQ